jgi:tetratricopeptide (TPR) repeat protein
LYNTRERLWGQRLPELVQLRRTQASAALNRAVAIDPKLAQAQLRLAKLYQDIGYFDLALAHLRTYQTLLPSTKSTATSDPAGDALGQTLARLENAVAERRKAYELEAANPRVLDRALAAYKYGLATTALDMLLESNVAAFGSQGLRLELELLLRTGRADAVVEWTSPDQKAAMGGATYHWLRIQALVAAGEYVRAREECDYLADDARGADQLQPWQLIAGLVGQAVLDEQPVGATAFDLAWRSMSRLRLYNRTLGLAKDLRQVANARVFRGLVALEEGNMEEAEVAFRLALAFWGSDEAVAFGAGLEFNARPLAETALGWIP